MATRSSSTWPPRSPAPPTACSRWAPTSSRSRPARPRSVELTVDPAKVETGTQLSGALIASIDGTEVARTALGTIAEQERYDLTVTATGFDGEPIGTYAVLYDVA